MIVSVDWLREYVSVDQPLDEVTDRLTMSGLNLEDIAEVDSGDVAIDLEVTSNRPDCLGHIGVARELAVLFEQALTIPEAQIPAGAGSITEHTSVEVECPEMCPQYSARLVRGVTVGPSPDWLVRRLEAAHWDYRLNETRYRSINNIVDITNYVMLECGQPLHAFDFARLDGRRIVVRRARVGEKITAIDQREYELDPEMCVIADASRPVAIGGVMGGHDTEISARTTDVLVEAAAFAPLSVRRTARTLKLFSPSSYRFERGVDRQMIDWASRRCCELILQLAGGELVEGVALGGSVPPDRREPVRLRFAQVPRLIGIDVRPDECASILTRLGLNAVERDAAAATFEPPSWRRDLTRECDLIEEVARIHGYENIPDDAAVPVVATARSRVDRVTDRIRETLVALGFFDCVTLSFVSEEQTRQFNPCGVQKFVSVDHSSRQKEHILRASIVPSLLACRRDNERHGTPDARLFEIARVYLAADTSAPEDDVEPLTISAVSGGSFADTKGVLEALACSLNRKAVVMASPARLPGFREGCAAELSLDGRPWGWIGEISDDVVAAAELRDPATVFEVRLTPLLELADLEPAYVPLPAFPSISRDLNFVIDEATTWEQLATVARAHGGQLLESVEFGGQYRGKGIEASRKSYVVTCVFRSPERTLTSEEVEAATAGIVEACERELRAELRA